MTAGTQCSTEIKNTWSPAYPSPYNFVD